MTDRELLEAAAKAAGMLVLVPPWPEIPDGYFWCDNGRRGSGLYRTGAVGTYWNPLTDDGDALRLAVKLEIEVCNFNNVSHAGQRNKFWKTERWFSGDDPYAATRRAIVRAAAAIGGAQ